MEVHLNNKHLKQDTKEDSHGTGFWYRYADWKKEHKINKSKLEFTSTRSFTRWIGS